MEISNSTGAEIRSAAAAVRRRWAAERAAAGDEADEDAPVAGDLKVLAKRLYRISVLASANLGSNVLGKVNRRSRVIQYRAALDEPAGHARRAFVIAHEIGHFVLGHRADVFEDDPRSINDEADPGELDVRDGVYRAYSTRERQELEANLFAGELLAPTRALARAVADDPEWSVDGLADRFGLTRPAVENRLAAVLLPSGENVLASVAPSCAANPPLEKGLGASASLGGNSKIPDPLQIAAAVAPCPALVVAGPGSGKTAVLVARYVRLVREEGCTPDQILALTYTNKAAAEMRARLVAALTGQWSPEELSRIQVTTLHGLGLDLITRHVEGGQGRPLPAPPRLLTDGDALFLLRRRLARLPLGSFEDLHDPLTHLGTILKSIAKAKQEGWTVEALRAEAARWAEEIARETERASIRLPRLEMHLEALTARREAALARKKGLPRVAPRAAEDDPTRMRKRAIDERVGELAARVKQTREARTAARNRIKRLSREAERAALAGDIATLYETYEAELAASGHADFCDLITRATRLVEMDAAAAASGAIRAEWRHILVDEFQDINWVCGRFLRALDGGRRIVWAVGDPEQSIYRFLGASPRNLAQFADDYPGASRLPLRVNYRSVNEVVRVGRALWGEPEGDDAGGGATADRHAHRGPFATAVASGGAANVAVTVLVADAEKTELAELARLAADHGAAGGRLSDIAVLCRTRRQAGSLSAAFENRGIATTWGGELFERDGFRHLMCVLLLACGDPRGLERLTRLPDYSLSLEDRTLLLNRAAEKDEDGARLGLRWALRAARKGQIPGLSEEGVRRAHALHTLMARLNEHRRKPEGKAPWRMIAAYLFTHSKGCRELLRRRLLALSASTASTGGAAAPTEGEVPLDLYRSVAAFAQTAALARGFAGRSRLLDGDSVHAFLDYVTTAIEHDCLEAPDEVPVPCDAVHVLTIHQSKGLEWPVVFIPNLSQGRFPPRGRTPLPLPPSILRTDRPRPPANHAEGNADDGHIATDTDTGSEESGESGENAADAADAADDERCLLYVAITRARDRLVLSRAETYHGETHAEAPFLTELLRSPSAVPHLSVRRLGGPDASSGAEPGGKAVGDG